MSYFSVQRSYSVVQRSYYSVQTSYFSVQRSYSVVQRSYCSVQTSYFVVQRRISSYKGRISRLLRSTVASDGSNRRLAPFPSRPTLSIFRLYVAERGTSRHVCHVNVTSVRITIRTPYRTRCPSDRLSRRAGYSSSRWRLALSGYPRHFPVSKHPGLQQHFP